MYECLWFEGNEAALAVAFLDRLDTTPYDKVRVRDLTDACGLSRTVFYRSFDDVLDLMEQLERGLMDRLGLYSRRGDRDEDGHPFESLEHWFAEVCRLRPVLRQVTGTYGDPYFKDRLAAKLRADLNDMMDDDRAPNDELRPYYVAQQAAGYIGLLSHVARLPLDEEPVPAGSLAVIANSARAAYYTCDAGAPAISSERLFGERGQGA